MVDNLSGRSRDCPFNQSQESGVACPGMAVFATEATRVTDEMFLIAAQAVAEQVTEENLSIGLKHSLEVMI